MGHTSQLTRDLQRQKKEIARLKRIVFESRPNRIYTVPQKSQGNTLVFGVIGDTHIGSIHERTDALTEFYKLLKSQGIRLVFHAGDMLAGHGVYRGQEYEVYALGFNAQKRALVERYPKIDGIETYFITGNHDASFTNQNGIDVGHELEVARSDLHFVGPDVADVRLRVGNKSVRYQLNHPSGGVAYAVSYKSQKIVESYSGGEKPRAVFIGHFHKADYMPSFRNVKALQVGCFESQSSFMKRKPTAAHIGGWIIEDTIGDGLADRFKAEFVAFYEPNEVKEIK